MPSLWRKKIDKAEKNNLNIMETKEDGSMTIISVEDTNVEDVDKYIQEYDLWQLHLSKNDRLNELQHQHAELSRPVIYPAADPKLWQPKTQLQKQRQEAKLIKMKQAEAEAALQNLANTIPDIIISEEVEPQHPKSSTLLALSGFNGMSAQMKLESTTKKLLFEHLSTTMMLDNRLGPEEGDEYLFDDVGSDYSQLEKTVRTSQKSARLSQEVAPLKEQELPN